MSKGAQPATSSLSLQTVAEAAAPLLSRSRDLLVAYASSYCAVERGETKHWLPPLLSASLDLQVAPTSSSVL